MKKKMPLQVRESDISETKVSVSFEGNSNIPLKKTNACLVCFRILLIFDNSTKNQFNQILFSNDSGQS